MLEYGPLSIDLDGLALSVARRDVRLTFSEFVLLRALALRPYRVLDRAALLEAIQQAVPGRCSELADVRLIDRHIARLRKKLHKAGCDCIETMRFAGYRFTPDCNGDQAGTVPFTTSSRAAV